MLVSRGVVEYTRLEVKDTKKSEAKDSPSEDRPSQGQEQECLRPRTKDTNASVLHKKGLQVFFSGNPKKTVKKKIFLPIYKILTIQKIVLSSSREQSNFFFKDLRLRGQGKDLIFKAKDYKMCPRGQGRPRGFHLCWCRCTLGHNCVFIAKVSWKILFFIKTIFSKRFKSLPFHRVAK